MKYNWYLIGNIIFIIGLIIFVLVCLFKKDKFNNLIIINDALIKEVKKFKVVCLSRNLNTIIATRYHNQPYDNKYYKITNRYFNSKPIAGTTFRALENEATKITEEQYNDYCSQ